MRSTVNAKLVRRHLIRDSRGGQRAQQGTRATVTAVLLLSSVACGEIDGTRPSAPERSTARILSATVGSAQRPKTLDEKFSEVAQQVPGFGGLFYDEVTGVPTVYLTDTSTALASHAAIEAIFHAHPRSVGMSPGAPGRVLKASYSWESLAAWRDQLDRSLLARAEVIATDVDERVNRVRVLVASAAQQRVQAAIASLGIPAGAVILEVSAGIEMSRAAAATAPVSLLDRWPKTPGGVQIDDRIGLCTLGFNAYKTRYQFSGPNGPYDLTPYFVTNAHCTNRMGGEEGTFFYQPSHSMDFVSFGNEVREPPWDVASYGNCFSAGCSLADAALVRYSQTARDWEYGRIARTNSRGSGGTAGSVIVNQNSPYFRISDTTESSGVFGQIVNKMGAATGWTVGGIVVTCMNHSISGTGLTLLCQDGFDARNDFGDSGAPIFWWGAGTTVTLAGILWGRERVGNRSYFSPYVYVRWELTREDRPLYCPGSHCWLGLQVSTPF
ncbi:MAG: hypothetical protein ACT4P6_18570 [Gemmatimonadaceae bacterium]